MRHSFPFGFEGGMRDLIVLIPDHCLSIYFPMLWKHYSISAVKQSLFIDRASFSSFLLMITVPNVKNIYVNFFQNKHA